MSIQDFFSSTCAVRSAGPEDEWGKETFVLGADKPCRFDPKTGQETRDGNGENINIDGIVYMNVADAPAEEDELVVDGDDYRVIRVTTQRGFGDVHHAKIMVRKK